MEVMYYQQVGSSYNETLKVLEADMQYANAMASAIPKAKDGAQVQMKLVYNQLAPLFLFLLQWMDCSSMCFFPRYLNIFHVLIYKVYTDGRPKITTCGSKATIRDFYAIILPSLQRLQSDLHGQDEPNLKSIGKTRLEGGLEGDSGFSNFDSQRDEECGICLEPCAKMVLPNCCHEMCINCYRDWSTRSESCPFCRDGLRRVKSRDLWVLTCDDDVVDKDTVSREDLLRFYRYISSLPKDSPDALFLMYYEYLI